MTELCKKILELRELGKTYDEIKDELECSKGTIAYYLGDGQKEKSGNRRRKYRSNQHPYTRKMEAFSTKSSIPTIEKTKSKFKKIMKNKIEGFHKIKKDNKLMYTKPEFTLEDVINKFGEHPKCYLTGQSINIYETSTYHFDHIIPRSKGGTNSIDNLGICTNKANIAKSDLSYDEFIKLCEDVVNYKTANLGIEPKPIKGL